MEKPKVDCLFYKKKRKMAKLIRGFIDLNVGSVQERSKKRDAHASRGEILHFEGLGSSFVTGRRFEREGEIERKLLCMRARRPCMTTVYLEKTKNHAFRGCAKPRLLPPRKNVLRRIFQNVLSSPPPTASPRRCPNVCDIFGRRRRKLPTYRCP